MEANSEHINQLIEGCRKKERVAQSELYRMYYKAMYNTAYRILGDDAEAEDSMQEAFISCFDKIESYKGEVAFGAWLKRIVINKSLTNLKKINRKSETKLGQVEYKLEDTSSSYQHDDSERMEKVKMVERCMEKLKDSYRIILQLSLMEGYDNEEIAEIMQITHENCRATLSRAKRKLREVWNSAYAV